MSQTLRLITMGILLLCLAGVGWRMYVLSQNELLWGHLPLALFGSAWLIHGLAWFPSSGQPRWMHPAILGLSSSLLLASAFPPVGFIPGIFLGFVPLFLIVDEARSGREVFRWSFFALFGWNVLTTFWVANANLGAGTVAMGLNSLFMAGILWLYYQIRMRFDGLGTLVLIPLWLAFEYLHFQWELNWPWLTLGNAFSALPSIVQWYEFTGALGGSLWALLVNALVFQAIKNPSLVRPLTAQIVLLLAIPIIGSLLSSPSLPRVDQDAALDILLVQPNFEPHYEQNQVNQQLQAKRMADLIRPELDESLDYVVLPETVLGGMSLKQIGSDRYTRQLQALQDSFPKVRFLIGLATHRFLTDDEAPTPFTRTLITKKQDTLRYERYNAAVQLSPAQKEEVGLYKKSRLVPGAEFFPFRTFLSFLEPIVDQMGGSVSGLGTQAERSVFSSVDGAKIAPIICYESVFGAFVGQYLAKEAQVLVIMTNDGWWDLTAGHKQHAAYARLRAIETRRWVVRAANTGISSVINATGQELARTQYGKTTVLRAQIPLMEGRTFY
ncbi:MAG: apolipoprotein N-acyltransferase, partial [Bacteroidota bacterium]